MAVAYERGILLFDVHVSFAFNTELGGIWENSSYLYINDLLTSRCIFH